MFWKDAGALRPASFSLLTNLMLLFEGPVGCLFFSNLNECEYDLVGNYVSLTS